MLEVETSHTTFLVYFHTRTLATCTLRSRYEHVWKRGHCSSRMRVRLVSSTVLKTCFTSVCNMGCRVTGGDHLLPKGWFDTSKPQTPMDPQGGSRFPSPSIYPNINRTRSHTCTHVSLHSSTRQSLTPPQCQRPSARRVTRRKTETNSRGDRVRIGIRDQNNIN